MLSKIILNNPPPSQEQAEAFERALAPAEPLHSHWSFFIAEHDAATANDKQTAHRFTQLCDRNPRCLVVGQINKYNNI